MPIQRTATTEGAALGIVTVRAPHELQDQEVVWLQDALLDQPGLIVKRNGWPAAGTFRKTVSTDTTNVCEPLGVVSCFDPTGASYYIMVVWYDAIRAGTSTDGIVWGTIYNSSFTLVSRQPLFHAISSWAGNEMLVPYFSHAMLPDGGCQISAAYGLNSGDYVNGQCVWYGAAPAVQYSSASSSLVINVTTTYGSNVISASAPDITKLVPGAIIDGVGIVNRILSGTTAQLTKPFHAGGFTGNRAVGAAMVPAPIRTRGLVTSSVAASTINGYGTSFKNMTDIARTAVHTAFVTSQADNRPIGIVTTGTGVTDTSGLTAGTVVRDTSLEPYFLYPQAPTGSPSQEWPNPYQVDGVTTAFNPWNARTAYASQRLGILCASYGGYTFWANSPNIQQSTISTTSTAQNLTQRIWITGPSNPYECDHSPDGTWLDVKSEKVDDMDIMAINSVPNGVVIGKRNSVWFLSGTSPDNFQLNKIHDDGIKGPQAP